MANQRRPLRRPLGERRYRRVFFVATEGTKTEPEYLALLDDQYSVIKVKWLKGASNRGFALSNPKFEYWLLLHFEDGAGVGTTVYRLVEKIQSPNTREDGGQR